MSNWNETIQNNPNLFGIATPEYDSYNKADLALSAKVAKYESVVDTFVSIYGFDPYGIYCLATGKRIGTSNGEIIDVIADMTDSDSEACADDLAMRLFASMRPSMRWNFMRVDTIDQLRKAVPVETMAYLLNRLMAPVNIRDESFADFCRFNGEKIKLFQLLSQWEIDDAFAQAMTQLLDIDSRRNLKDIKPSFSMLDLLKLTSWTQLAALLDPWHTKQLQAWADSQREAKFLRANPMAKSAFLRAAIETKPPTKIQQKKLERKQKDAFMVDLLRELLDGDSAPREQSEAPAPKPKPVTPQIKPIKFGVKRS